MKGKSKNNLVSQYLENISKSLLEKYPGIIKKYARYRHGIYALYKKKKLYYVGLASNLRSRLKHHLRDRHANAWDSFSIYLTVGGEYTHELEALILRIIERKGNRQRGKFARAEDLRGQLKQDIKKALSLEVEKIFGQTSSSAKIKKKLKDSKIKKREGRIPVLGPFVKRRFHIRLKYKNKMYIAHVRNDGTISFASHSAEAKRLQGKSFTSPSLAARHITGRAMNGWTTWTYERAPGDWVLLDELRK